MSIINNKTIENDNDTSMYACTYWYVLHEHQKDIFSCMCVRLLLLSCLHSQYDKFISNAINIQIIRNTDTHLSKKLIDMMFQSITG